MVHCASDCFLEDRTFPWHGRQKRGDSNNLGFPFTLHNTYFTYQLTWVAKQNLSLHKFCSAPTFIAAHCQMNGGHQTIQHILVLLIKKAHVQTACCLFHAQLLPPAYTMSHHKTCSAHAPEICSLQQHFNFTGIAQITALISCWNKRVSQAFISPKLVYICTYGQQWQ